MNWLTICMGVFALGFGAYSIFLRIKSPSKFGKLEAMKQVYGQRAGSIIHTISYTIIPVVVGIALISAGIKGGSLFGE